MSNPIATESELQAWLDAECVAYAQREKERKVLEMAALRAFNFEHAKFNFQREMYSWMLKRKMQGTISVDIQDVETTIAILSKEAFLFEIQQ